MSQWIKRTYVNEWTGEERVTWRKQIDAGPESIIHLQVYSLGGRLYWSANILIAYRPDLSYIANGRYADIPGALAVAKARASRIANDAVRKSATRRQFAHMN